MSTLSASLLFIIAKIWKQPKCPSLDECIKKMQYIYTMEYWSTFKKMEILSLVTTLMIPETIMLNEISQAQKDKYHLISLICNIKIMDSKKQSNDF
jgi:hypothetical protein